MRTYYIAVTVLFYTLLMGCISESGSGRFNYQSFKNVDDVQVRETGDFSSVKLSGDFVVFLENGDENSLEFKGSQRLLDRVLINHSNDELTIELLGENVNRRQDETVAIKLTVKNLKYLSGMKRITLNTPYTFEFDTLQMDFAGAVTVDLILDGQYLGINFAGATSALVEGKVDHLKINMPGAGKLNAYELMADKVDLVLAGAGSANIYAQNELRVDVAGACVVNYKGNPENVYSNVSGIGRIRAVD